jgi:hypothetical protein
MRERERENWGELREVENEKKLLRERKNMREREREREKERDDEREKDDVISVKTAYPQHWVNDDQFGTNLVRRCKSEVLERRRDFLHNDI